MGPRAQCRTQCSGPRPALPFPPPTVPLRVIEDDDGASGSSGGPEVRVDVGGGHKIPRERPAVGLGLRGTDLRHDEAGRGHADVKSPLVAYGQAHSKSRRASRIDRRHGFVAVHAGDGVPALLPSSLDHAEQASPPSLRNNGHHRSTTRCCPCLPTADGVRITPALRRHVVHPIQCWLHRRKRSQNNGVRLLCSSLQAHPAHSAPVIRVPISPASGNPANQHRRHSATNPQLHRYSWVETLPPCPETTFATLRADSSSFSGSK